LDEPSGKAERGEKFGKNQNSSEKGSEKSSGKGSESSRTSIQEKSSEKHIFCDLSSILARKLQKPHLKIG